MTLKCKNPYFDENIDRKFVFLLYSVLIAKGINLGEKFDGLFISDNKVGILETHLDYEMAVLKEVSVYEAFEHCIPDGMRYNKELDKLVPDVISASNEYCSGIKVEIEKVMDYTDKKENNPIEPNHYTEMKISPLEYIEANQGDFTWCIANVIKYVSRHKRKNGIEDLKKAQWYLNHEINNLEIIEGMANVN